MFSGALRNRVCLASPVLRQAHQLRTVSTLRSPARFPTTHVQAHKNIHRVLLAPSPSSRNYSASTTTKESATETKNESTPAEVADYEGPLSNTWRRLKLFSLASFGLSSTLAPFMFIVESGLPYSARFALAGVAMGSSGLSTALVSWCAKPYVTKMRRYTSEGSEVIEMTTRTLFLKPLVTTVYDPEFLVETRRPMAKWELAREILLPKERIPGDGKELVGKQETVAETVDHKGEVVGRWVVEWSEGGEGKCHEAGYVVRHFNVHEELLS